MWQIRSAIVLLAITLVIPRWPKQDFDWQVGEVVRGSLRLTDDGYAFVLARRLGGSDAERFVEVRTHGSPSPSVCDGASVFLEGIKVSPQSFAAEDVRGINDGKYDHCWEKRCDRAAYDACRGHRGFD